MIFGERIVLTSVHIHNLEKLRQWKNSPAIQDYSFDSREITEQQQQEWYENQICKNKNLYIFEIHKYTRNNDSTTQEEISDLIGLCNLKIIDETARIAEFSISIGDQSQLGKGYATEALNLLFRYGFRNLNLHKIGGQAFDYNTGACRLYEKLGFKVEGRLRQAHFRFGKYHDILYIGLLSHEFKFS